MGVIATSKYGDCTVCGMKDTDCRKRGKVLICLQCCRTSDNKVQMQKANDRNKVRALGRTPENKELLEHHISLDKWFNDRRKEMTGVCQHCGGKSCKDDDKFFKFSCCHLLPKAYFPSIATNPYNFLELCFWGNNCHGNMDNKILDFMDMNCFDQIIQKFVKIYPSIAKNERRRIPEILLQYLEVET